jgi:hypothetical protein
MNAASLFASSPRRLPTLFLRRATMLGATVALTVVAAVAIRAAESPAAKKKAPGSATPTIKHNGDMDHNYIIKPRVTSTRVFDLMDGPGLTAHKIGELSVVWTNDGTSMYKAKITYAANGVPLPQLKLSCYNIGLQGRLFDVTVKSVNDGTAAGKAGVQFFKPDEYNGPGLPRGKWIDATALPAEIEIKRAGMRVATPGPNPAHEDKVWGLAFTGPTCEVVVDSHRVLHGPMVTLLDAHNTTPPPPEPGGQDGDSL